MVYRKIFVSGRVQGVFYRDTTRQQATALSLAGYVRNLRDGRVEVAVSGSDESVEILIKWLKTGPKSAKVSNIEVIDIEADAWPCHDDSGFAIWPTQ